MSTFNITLSNPSPEAVRELIKSLDNVQQSKTVEIYSRPGETFKDVAERVTRVLHTSDLHTGPVISQKSYIFDLDGVLADHRHRLHFINQPDMGVCKTCGHPREGHTHTYYRGFGKGYGAGACNHNHAHQRDIGLPCFCKRFIAKVKPQWDEYYAELGNDPPIENNVFLLNLLAATHRIVFITGRPEEYRKATEEWIAKFINITDYEMYMRPTHNFSKNADLKKQIIEEQAWLHESDVAGVVEDNPDTVQMYRDLGFKVIQVPSAFNEGK